MANTNVIQYRQCFQPVLTRQQFAGDAQLLPAWWGPLSEPRQFQTKRALSSAVLASGQAPIVKALPFPENPQVDKWFVALSEPNHFKVKPALSFAINATGPQSPVLTSGQFAADNQFMAGWWLPLSEPNQYKYKPSLPFAIQSGADFPPDSDLPIVPYPDNWWLPFGEPNRFKCKPDLDGSIRASGPIFYPYPPEFIMQGYIRT